MIVFLVSFSSCHSSLWYENTWRFSWLVTCVCVCVRCTLSFAIQTKRCDCTNDMVWKKDANITKTLLEYNRERERERENNWVDCVTHGTTLRLSKVDTTPQGRRKTFGGYWHVDRQLYVIATWCLREWPSLWVVDLWFSNFISFLSYQWGTTW